MIYQNDVKRKGCIKYCNDVTIHMKVENIPHYQIIFQSFILLLIRCHRKDTIDQITND